MGCRLLFLEPKKVGGESDEFPEVVPLPMTGGRATLGSQDGVVGPGAAHLAASSPLPLSLPGLVICSEKEMGGVGTVRSDTGELVASLVFLCLLCSYLSFQLL